MSHGQKTPKHKQQKQYCNKFNRDFKNGPHFKNLKKKKEKEPCTKIGLPILFSCTRKLKLRKVKYLFIHLPSMCQILCQALEIQK